MSSRSLPLFAALILSASALPTLGLAQEAAVGTPSGAASQSPLLPATTAPSAQAPTPPAEANAPVATDKVGTPPPGKGQVVFFRPSALQGAVLSFSVHDGATGVGKLGNGTYFVVIADPGPHTYSIQSEAKDTLNLEVEAGETQYVKQTIGMGIMMARPHLTPSDQTTFEKLNLKPSTKTPTDLKPTA